MEYACGLRMFARNIFTLGSKMLNNNRIMNKPTIPLDLVPKILEEFFVKDKGLIPKGLIRNSTLLSCKRDFLFLRGTKLDQPPYSMSKDQIDAIHSNLPSFAAILVYCSSIDLLARVMKRKTGSRKSREYFLWSARRWFNLNYNQSNALWKLRCAMSHQYMIDKGQRAVPFGFPGSMMYDRKYKKWVFNLNGMFGNIRHAIDTTFAYINSKTDKTKQEYANFIYEYGFFYTQAN